MNEWESQPARERAEEARSEIGLVIDSRFPDCGVYGDKQGRVMEYLPIRDSWCFIITLNHHLVSKRRKIAKELVPEIESVVGKQSAIFVEQRHHKHIVVVLFGGDLHDNRGAGE